MAQGSCPGLDDTVVPDSSPGYLDSMDPMAVRPSNHHMASGVGPDPRHLCSFNNGDRNLGHEPRSGLW